MNNRNPAHDQLARRVFDALAYPNSTLTDLLDEALRMVTGLSDLLAVHGDTANFHGLSIEAVHVDAAAASIRQQARLIAALVAQLTDENRRLTVALEAQAGPEALS
ncbi:hypothetical protein [Thiocystis violascens]|uniref:Uncharacterized protein n=1 Tax=Thiocystis violascens (strain ATCC 17096 / DSM 198 / 6111) TaxID=765911 RepID=I3YBE3_THIV6|nr:hypothetical protein [Thiocystis violascens]AFL74311.1 hypothetical protein Thivi_2366 [Thiocystis violascens DSM 198]